MLTCGERVSPFFGKEGSHETWSHPEAPDLRLTVSGNDGDDAKPYQERQLREQLAALRARRSQGRPNR